MADPRTYAQGIGSLQTHDAKGNLIEEAEEVPYRLLSPAKMDTGKVMMFSMPSAVALAFDLAISSAEAANRLRAELNYEQGVDQRLGKTETVGPDRTVYDCIQQSMQCVTFSYQALETYCNEQMSLYPDVIVEVTIRRDQSKEKRAVSTCDRVSTESKLNEVLPVILGKSRPKELVNVWSRFKRLQNERNAVVHMHARTSRPHNTGVGQVPKATIFHKFLEIPDTMWMPKVATDMLLHFGVADDWFKAIKTRLANR